MGRCGCVRGPDQDAGDVYVAWPPALIFLVCLSGCLYLCLPVCQAVCFLSDSLECQTQPTHHLVPAVHTHHRWAGLPVKSPAISISLFYQISSISSTPHKIPLLLHLFNASQHLFNAPRHKHHHPPAGSWARCKPGETRLALCLPAGIPDFLKKVPAFSNILRGICIRTIRRLMADIDAAAQKVCMIRWCVCVRARARGHARICV